VLPSPRREANGTAPPLGHSPPLSPRFNNRLVMLQARIRGVQGRRKVQEKRVLKAAQSTGVLVALNCSEQGGSGWYQAPGGDVFYFVRDDQAEWLLAAGPITRADYDEAVRSAQVVPGSASNSLAAGGSGASFAMMKKLNRIQPGDILRRCAFELAVEHEDVQGDVFIANKSNKLFVAVSVDSLLLDSQFAYSSMDNGSSLATDTVATGDSMAFQ